MQYGHHYPVEGDNHGNLRSTHPRAAPFLPVPPRADAGSTYTPNRLGFITCDYDPWEPPASCRDCETRPRRYPGPRRVARHRIAADRCPGLTARRSRWSSEIAAGDVQRMEPAINQAASSG